MHSRPLHDASAYLPAKRHPNAASVPDHHAVVSSLSQAQAQAVAAARIYPYGPASSHSAAAAAEANNRMQAAYAAYHHSMAGATAPPGGPASSIPPPVPQPPPGSSAAASAAAAAALSQLSHLNHHPSLNSLFIAPPGPPGSHNGAIVAPYRETLVRSTAAWLSVFDLYCFIFFFCLP